jgi:RNA polymerase sigma factor (sigma-70 family)
MSGQTMTNSTHLTEDGDAAARLELEQLARLHADWIYSAARRIVRDPHLAEDVTQAVFLVMAKNLKKLSGLRSPTGWILGVTRYCALHSLREMKRRAHHERQAAMATHAMQSAQELPDWEQIAPHLDELVHRLSSRDREAVLLRYYRQMSIAQVAEATGISEEAAKKRLSRAVEKLRGLFSRKDVLLPAAALAVAMTTNTTHAAPANLVRSCGVSIAGKSVGIQAIAKGGISLMLINKLKLVALWVLAFLIPATAATVVYSQWSNPAPTAAPAAAPLASNLPETMPAAADPNFDSQAIAILTPQTSIVLAVNPNGVDANAIADWAKSMIADLPLSDPRKNDLLEKLPAYSELVSNWIHSYHDAGGRTIYLSEDLSGKTPSVFLAIGEAQGADSNAIMKSIPIPMLAHRQFEDLLILGTNARQVDAIVKGAGGTKSELAPGLDVEPNADIREVFQPQGIRTAFAMFTSQMARLSPTTNPSGGMFDMWNSVAMDNVIWVAGSISLPPNEHCSMTAVCTDPDSAAAVAKELNDPIEADIKSQMDDFTKVLGDKSKSLENISATVQGSTVTLTCDKTALDALIEYYAIKAINSSAPTTQP